MTRTCAASPFNCKWIVQSSIAQLGDYTYAVCQRDRHRDRIVNEGECARCPLWAEFDIAAGEPEAWCARTQSFRF